MLPLGDKSRFRMGPRKIASSLPYCPGESHGCVLLPRAIKIHGLEFQTRKRPGLSGLGKGGSKIEAVFQKWKDQSGLLQQLHAAQRVDGLIIFRMNNGRIILGVRSDSRTLFKVPVISTLLVHISVITCGHGVLNFLSTKAL